MIYQDHCGIVRQEMEISDIPEMLRGLGDLLFMAQGADISIEDSALRLIDYICNSFAADIEADLKRRGIKE